MRAPLIVHRFAFTAAVVGSSMTALAQPEISATRPEEDAAVRDARDAFVRAAELARGGRWSEALAAFEQSSAMHQHPVTTYNIGYCERALGRSTRARKRFTQALGQEAAAPGAMPEAMRAEATRYVAEAEARVGRITVVLVGGPASLTVDGHPLEPDPGTKVLLAGTSDARDPRPPPASTFELWADPGRHVLVASRTGSADVVQTIDVAPGGRQRLVVDATSVDDPEPDVVALPAEHTDDSIDGRFLAPIVAYATGASGLVVGAILGGVTLAEMANLDAMCGGDGQTCPPGSEDDQAAVRDHAAVATIGFTVAVAGAALGTVLLLIAPSEPAPATPGSVRIWFDAGGVRGSF